jgi:hypothetical protein
MTDTEGGWVYPCPRCGYLLNGYHPPSCTYPNPKAGVVEPEIREPSDAAIGAALRAAKQVPMSAAAREEDWWAYVLRAANAADRPR